MERKKELRNGTQSRKQDREQEREHDQPRAGADAPAGRTAAGRAADERGDGGAPYDCKRHVPRKQCTNPDDCRKLGWCAYSILR